MLKIYAGRLQAAQQNVLALLELEPKESKDGLVRYYMIAKVQHVWFGDFDVHDVEGTHIFQADFEAYSFPLREFDRAQAQLVREIRRRGNDLRNQMNNVLAEANFVERLERGNERV